MSFKPMLADPANLELLDYGNLWASPKLDGIRAIVINGVVVSRSLKPIRNAYVQHLFGRPELEHYDGELIVGDPTAKDCYSVTNSGVMSADGEPDVTFHAFDHIRHPTIEYWARHAMIEPQHRVEKVPQYPCESEESLLDLEQWLLGQGYEGLMLRKHSGPLSFYKYGRSTAKEGSLVKLKRMVTDEAPIIGYEEEMANNNEATTNALGRTERSSHKDKLVGKGRLGAVVCRHPSTGFAFKIGTGFDAKTRSSLWEQRDSLPGKIAKYVHFPIGVKDAPRFPVWLGFRDPIDM